MNSFDNWVNEQHSRFAFHHAKLAHSYKQLAQDARLQQACCL